MKTPNVPGKLLAILVLVAGALGILAYFWDTAGGDLPFQAAPYKVTATLRESQQLAQNADVRAAGVKIGSVERVRNVADGVEVVLHINKKHAPVYKDATLLVRQKTLVGENYIEVAPGSAKAGAIADGGRITVKAQREAVPIDRVLSALDEETRNRVSRNLRSSGKGVDGRAKDLNELFTRIPQASASGMKLMEVLDDQRAQVASIVQDTGVLMQAIGSRSGDVQRLITSVRATATAVGERDQALKFALATIPGTFRQARGTVDRLTTFAGTATPVVTDVQTALTTLRPVLNQLVPTARRTRQLVDALPALTRAANPTLDELRTFAGDAVAVVPATDGFLRETNPLVSYLKPYHREVGALLANFGTGNMLDNFGTFGRCLCPVSDRTFANWTPELRALVAPLLDQGLVAQVMDMKRDAYRPAGRLPFADSEQKDGEYTRIGPDPSRLPGSPDRAAGGD